jgi:4-amino-4-deoxy-L-arabinose transferase-like glycosyltransferase
MEAVAQKPIERTASEQPGEPPIAAKRRGWVRLLAVVILTFALIAPTLTWQEFSSGVENLNVATAMEILRNDRWLVPTLEGEPRVAKPPLTAWMTTTSIDRDTFGAMSSTDAAVRARAERQLAWQVRWPFLLSSCLMLLAAAELGRVVGGGDWRISVIAAAACASNLFFLRHGRLATTDVQLALWVAITNVFLAHAVMRGRGWTGAIGAGLALGLAFMSKGPVAIVQTVAPAVAFVLWDAWTSRRRGTRDAENGELAIITRHATPWGRRIAQILLGLALFTLVALPWYALVAAKNPDVWARWQAEVTREGATDLPPGNWYAYISFLAFIAPWTAFLIAGIAVIIYDLIVTPRDKRSRGMFLALLMLLVPIVIMSFFRDRKERYLLPMIVPASVVIARAVVEHFETRHLRNLGDRIVIGIHWTTLLLIAIGLPVAGAVTLTTRDGGQWFSPGVAIAGGMIGVAIVIGGMIVHRRCGAGIVAATLLLMLGMQMLFMHGYRDSRDGRSAMKRLATAIWREAPPTAPAFTTGSKRMRAPTDLAIYLNRSVRWVDSASDVPASVRPAILVIRQRQHEGPPMPVGAVLIEKTERDESSWHAFLLPAP